MSLLWDCAAGINVVYFSLQSRQMIRTSNQASATTKLTINQKWLPKLLRLKLKPRQGSSYIFFFYIDCLSAVVCDRAVTLLTDNEIMYIIHVNGIDASFCVSCSTLRYLRLWFMLIFLLQQWVCLLACTNSYTHLFCFVQVHYLLRWNLGKRRAHQRIRLAGQDCEVISWCFPERSDRRIACALGQRGPFDPFSWWEQCNRFRTRSSWLFPSK